jgi:imidazolonepropionase-like amidohydrolase
MKFSFSYFAAMSALLIKNIKQLVQVRENANSPIKGSAMADLPSITNAWVLVKHGIIEDFGSMDTCPEDPKAVVDATGKLVLPAWCDSHTHLVFADTREDEFVGRIKGLTYQEIASSEQRLKKTFTKALGIVWTRLCISEQELLRLKAVTAFRLITN